MLLIMENSYVKYCVGCGRRFYLGNTHSNANLKLLEKLLDLSFLVCLYCGKYVLKKRRKEKKLERDNYKGFFY